MFKTEEADYVSVIVKSCVQRVNWSERPGDTYRTAAGNNENTRLNILHRKTHLSRRVVRLALGVNTHPYPR